MDEKSAEKNILEQEKQIRKRYMVKLWQESVQNSPKERCENERRQFV